MDYDYDDAIDLDSALTDYIYENMKDKQYEESMEDLL